MPLIAIANIKGDQGCSTWSAILKRHLNGSGLLFDLDPQRGDAHAWAAAAGVQSKLLWPENLSQDLEAAAADCLWWHVADCPSRKGKETRTALALASIIFIPIVPGQAQDAQDWARMSALLNEAWKTNPDMEAIVLLNAVQPSALAPDFLALLEAWHSPEDGRSFIGSVPLQAGITETIAKGKAPKGPAIRQALVETDRVVRLASRVAMAKHFIRVHIKPKAGSAYA